MLCLIYKAYPVKLKFMCKETPNASSRLFVHTLHSNRYHLWEYGMFCLFITFMNAYVRSKMSRLAESFVTNITLIGFITCVNSQMSLQTA